MRGFCYSPSREDHRKVDLLNPGAVGLQTYCPSFPTLWSSLEILVSKETLGLMASPATSPLFLIDQILPTQAVHLVSGPSGVGKTTFLLQLLNDWNASKDVLGHKSFPGPFCFISCARGAEEARSIVSRCEFSSLPADSFASLPYDRS